MLDDSKGLKEIAQVAKNSSVRAYAGHNYQFRHIFDVKSLNLTEFARSFGIYKSVHESILNKRPSHPRKGNFSKDDDATDGKKELAAMNLKEGEASEMFTKRL
jgi:hypothetical protein